MSNFPTETTLQLALVGYVPVSGHGFALPYFAQHIVANATYIARCNVPGAPSGKIIGFEIAGLDYCKTLPKELVQLVQIGDPWIDVFLWGDQIWVGTKPEIWRATIAIRRQIANFAPLTLLTLAEGSHYSILPPSLLMHFIGSENAMAKTRRMLGGLTNIIAGWSRGALRAR